MKKINHSALLEKYKTCQTEAEQMEAVKEFMFSLSPDDLFKWMTEGTDFIYESLSELLKTDNPEDLHFVKSYIHSLEMIMNKETLLGKAA